MTTTTEADRSPVVLVLAEEGDPTADAVIMELARRRTPVVRMDIGDFPVALNVVARTGKDGWRSSLDGKSGAVELDRVRAVYYHRPTRFRLPAGMSSADEAFAAAEARYGLGGVLASMNTFWVNDPTRIALAEYKPLQLQVAARSGLAIPETLVTNDPAALARFAADESGTLICKTLSSLVFSEGGADPVATFTTRIDPATVDPDQFAATAHLIQRWVAKAYDARVTVVGRRPFAVAIRTESDRGRLDWRSDYTALTYERIDTPADVTAAIGRYLDHLGLNYGAFDFVITPDDAWVMLECNPAGHWLWLEHETGVPIAAALADLLTEGALL